MKKAIYVFGVIIVAAILIILFYPVEASDDYIEQPSDFGIWGQDIKINFKDGSSSNLKSLPTATSYLYEGKEIVSVSYHLYANIVEAGGVMFDFTNFKITFKVDNETAYQMPCEYYHQMFVNTTNEWSDLYIEGTVPIGALLSPSDFGNHKITIEPTGIYRFRIAESQWMTKDDIPSPTDFYVTVEQTQTIVFDFSHQYLF